MISLISSLINSNVSWSTKGDNKVTMEMGLVKMNKGENMIEVAVPTAEANINMAYEDDRCVVD